MQLHLLLVLEVQYTKKCLRVQSSPARIDEPSFEPSFESLLETARTPESQIYVFKRRIFLQFKGIWWDCHRRKVIRSNLVDSSFRRRITTIFNQLFRFSRYVWSTTTDSIRLRLSFSPFILRLSFSPEHSNTSGWFSDRSSFSGLSGLVLFFPKISTLGSKPWFCVMEFWNFGIFTRQE